MPIEPLTAREWFLVRATEEATLMTVIRACEQSGWPGSLVAKRLLEEREAHLVRLKAKIEDFLKGYKPDA